MWKVAPPLKAENRVTRGVPLSTIESRVSDSGEVVPIPTRPPELTVKALPPTVRSEEKRLVDEAVVEKRLVVVALVEVELRAVKLRRVEEPLIRRLEREVRPPVAVRVPVKLAAELMV